MSTHPSRQFTPFQKVVYNAYYATMPHLESRMIGCNIRPAKIRLVYNDAAFKHLGEQLLEIAGARIYGLPVELIEADPTIAGVNIDRPIIRLDLFTTAPYSTNDHEVVLNGTPITVYIDDQLDQLTTYEWEIPA